MTKPALISVEMYRKFQIIQMLVMNGKCTSAMLQKETGMSLQTIIRHIKKLRHDFDLKIEFVRWKGLVGKHGYYEIKDWGVLDKDRTIQFIDLLLRGKDKA